MRWLSLLALTGLSGAAMASCDFQVYQVDTLNHLAQPGTPKVGDPWFGVRGLFHVVGTPNGQGVRVRVSCGGQTYTWTNVSIPGPGDYWWYGAFDSSLDGTIPIRFEIDAAGASGDTNLSNNSLSSTFTPQYPLRPIETYGDKVIEASQGRWNQFQAGGNIGKIEYLLPEPNDTGIQGPVTNYVPPAGSIRSVTDPMGTVVRRAQWLNLNTSTNSRPTAVQTFRTTTRDTRVNPDLMNTVPWSAVDSPVPVNVAPWKLSEQWVPTNSPEITELINLNLPADYRTSLTPWQAAKKVFLGPVKKLTYDASIYRNPLGAWRDGRGQCGDYSWLFVVAMRRLGFAARINAGWRTGVYPSEAITHVWAEFWMPGVGWVPADATDSDGIDPDGNYAYHFGTVPDLDTRVAVSLGGDLTWPGIGWNCEFLQVPWWYWSGGANYVDGDATLANRVYTDGTLVPHDPEMVGGVPTVATFELRDPAPAGGTVVNLSSNNASLVVPSSVNVPAGWRQINVSLNTNAVTANANATLTATFSGGTRTAAIKIRPYKLTVVANSRYVAPGAGLPFTVDFGQVQSRALRAIVETDPPTGSPITVTVPIGSRSATGLIFPPLSATDATVKLLANIGSEATSDSALIAGEKIDLVPSRTEFKIGQSATLTVRLATPATGSGVRVALKSTNARLTVTGSVLIPAGSTTGTATLKCYTGSAMGPVSITANSARGTSALAISVVP